MKTIYITGHRNPDLDSICSALAYANLKNLIDPKNNYVAIRCSHIGDGMSSLLESLNITPPIYKSDIFPKVADIMLTSDEKIDASMLLTDFSKLYKEGLPAAFPVFDNGEYCGLVSIEDIAKWMLDKLSENSDITEPPQIRELIRKQEPPIDVNARYGDAKTILLNSKKRGVTVFDKGNFVGYVTRRCFVDEPKHSLIMVDHNEPEQSIVGIETANIVEIIDHHRLNAVKTDLPLFIDAEPLGSTCTIVYQLYLRNGIRPDPITARTLLAGLISDTLILKSPTTTKIDIETAHILCAICDENVEEFGKLMFSNMKGMKSRDPKETIASDFKKYTQKDVRIGIGQCEVTTLHDINDYVDDYLSALEETRSNNGLNWAILMVTDVLRERSVLLSTAFHAECHLPYTQIFDHVYDMPGVMSRKKQLLPEILHTLNM